MKQFYLLFTFLLVTNFLTAQEGAFITTWEVEDATGLHITITTLGNNYNYTVDFGDGTVLTNQTGDVTHGYDSPGIYTVSISGDFPRIIFNEFDYSSDKILTIEQWGDIEWQNMESAFGGCSNLNINAIDTPDLTEVDSLKDMFFNNTSLNANLNNWDVSNIIGMESMFYGCTQFNSPLDNWDVSNVIYMAGMFGKSNFNQSINNWDVSNVIDMNYMFWRANSFNQPLNNWDISNVTNLEYMFSEANSFNQPLNNWNTSNVTIMEGMFKNANSFNQPLNNWNTSNVANMSFMFTSAIEFNQPLDNWDVSNVTNMGEMFSSNSTGVQMSFNKPLNNWDVSNVASMSKMFMSNSSFNQPLNNWNTSNVNNMRGMFENAYSFNQPLDNWDVSNVNYIADVFYYSTTFNQDLSNWEINTSDLFHILSYSGLDINNYDLFLNHLRTIGLNNGNLLSDGLEYCDQVSHDYLEYFLGWNIQGDSQSLNCNTIHGEIQYDEDNNGCDENDLGVTDFMIEANDGTNNFITFSTSGSYTLGTMGDSYTLSVVNSPEYYTLSPESVAVDFSVEGDQEQDFCLTANQTVSDLNITLLPISEARPGFEADYQLVVENMGTQIVAATNISLTFDENSQDFVTATPSEISNTTNELTFEVNDLPPFGQQVIDFTMQTFQPPTVNGDDVLSFNAEVTPNTNDYTPEDNTFNFEQIVVNSYDPNDKQVLQGAQVHIDDADQYLDYLIRFQNTGTASAINVRVVDTLHPNLDYNTLKPINASDNYRVEITNGNHVEFIFDDINLPHEASDEEGSNGFIAYKIKPKENSVVGDVISGDAQIYFDFNAPIITNMVATEFVDNLGVDSVNSAPSQVVVYPNPANTILNLQPNRGVVLEEVTIYNLQGRKLLSFNINLEQLNLENLSSGMYILNIQTNEGSINKQLVKK